MADEPVATGTLAKTPLAHLLIYLEQKALSGTLAVWPEVIHEAERRQDRILFLKGRPVAGRMMEPARTLRESLLRLFDRRDAPYAFYEANLLGGAEDRLNGRVDPWSLVAEWLRGDARDEVVEAVLSRLGSARLRIAQNVDFTRFELQDDERAAIELMLAEPLALEQLEACAALSPVRSRRLAYLLLITKSVAPIEAPAAPPSAKATAAVSTAAAPTTEGAPASHARHPAVIESMPSPAAHPAVIESVSSSARHPAVIESMPSPPAASPEGASQPALGAGTSKSPAARLERLADLPPPPQELSPELTARWTKIVARARLIENQNYFEMLGLDKQAQGPEIKAEFFKLAKDFHPDRLPPELAALRGCVDIIFGYLNEAYKTLDDDEQRVAYLRTVREGGGTPASERLMQQILDSAIAYERVQVFARKREYDEALQLIQQILAVTKDEPDYHAMHAWLLMHKFPAADAPNGKIMAALDRALELHPEHERAHECKAKMLQRLGRQAEALRHYKRVVAINPNNVDAAREVRIAGMREAQEKSSPKNAAVGFLGKLLGTDRGSSRTKKR